MSDTVEPAPVKRPTHRFLTVANFAFAATSIVLFIVIAYATRSNIGVLAAAIVGTTAGAGVWWVSTSVATRKRMNESLGEVPLLGAIPPHDASSAPALGDSDSSAAYAKVASALEGETNGRVLLVGSVEPRQGATTVAMNLAISAARSGRRIVLVDGDADQSGVSRFMSSGVSPGVTDIATGESTLSDAARMWVVDDTTMLPVVPSGEPITDVVSLGGIHLSDAVEAMAERADVILIDVPPAMTSDATKHLAAHADGTVLVVTENTTAGVVAEAEVTFAEIGAPVVGYVAIRPDRRLIPLAKLWKPIAWRIAVGAILLLAVFTAITGAQLLDSWNRIEREAFDLADARAILSDGSITTATTATTDSTTTSTTMAEAPGTPTTTVSPLVPLADEPYRTILLIGGDEDSGASDVILYLVMPTNGAAPFMISFPRDLYVDNPCTGGSSRINSLSHGCRKKGINGGTLLSVQISEMTGIDVDHFAEFTFDGFADIIDTVGGVEICVGEYDVRDFPEAKLELPAGCTTAAGTQALSWVRSRHTEILKDGRWRSMPGAGDRMRNTRQQDVLFEMATKLKAFESPQQLTQAVSSVADTFTLSDTLDLPHAISLAWSLHGLDLEDINRLVIPTRLTRSPNDQSILRANLTVKEVIAAVYGDTLPLEVR
jgi:LCP family protein required for cell wall assembly